MIRIELSFDCSTLFRILEDPVRLIVDPDVDVEAVGLAPGLFSLAAGVIRPGSPLGVPVRYRDAW